MLHLKFFIFYSIVGFIFESTVFKITKSHNYSGILYGPYTIVYGFGGIICFTINNLLTSIQNCYLNYFLCFLSFVITCTLIELISGNIIKILFKIDKWNYSNHKYHLGKYICLDYALIWGIFALIFIKIPINYIYQLLDIIPFYMPIIVLIIMIIDFFITLKRSL